MLVLSLFSTVCSVADNNKLRKWCLLTKKSLYLLASVYIKC